MFAGIFSTPFINKKKISGIRILAAEDNPTNQSIISAIFEGTGVELSIVSNGKETVRIATENEFDLVLMDVQMTEIDGYEATQQIREWEKSRQSNIPGLQIPIIAMTAHAMKGDEEKCLEAGMDDYLTKPINQEKLFATLYEYTENKKRALSKIEESTSEMEETTETMMENSSKKTEGLPSSLPGINFQKTIKQLGIEANIFKRIISGFYKRNLKTKSKLIEAFDTENWTLLRKLTHDIKGSGANIGAEELQDKATQLERNCKETQTGPHQRILLEDLIKALEQVLSSLKTLEE